MICKGVVRTWSIHLGFFVGFNFWFIQRTCIDNDEKWDFLDVMCLHLHCKIMAKCRWWPCSFPIMIHILESIWEYFWRYKQKAYYKNRYVIMLSYTVIFWNKRGKTFSANNSEVAFWKLTSLFVNIPLSASQSTSSAAPGILGHMMTVWSGPWQEICLCHEYAQNVHNDQKYTKMIKNNDENEKFPIDFFWN